MRNTISATYLLLILALGLHSVHAQTNIYVIGDTRSNDDIHQTTVNRIAEEDYVAVVNTGDLMAKGYLQEQWETFIQISQPLLSKNKKAPNYLAVIGNHDVSGKEDPYKFWHQYLTWLPGNGEYYYQDFDNVRMIFLNSMAENDQTQTDSLKSWLDSNTQEWLIVTWHYPALPFGSKPMDKESLQDWWPLLYEADVDLILNGHAHYYARSKPLKPLAESCEVDEKNGVIQIILGGSGAGLYPLWKDKYNQAYFDFALEYGNDKVHHYAKISLNESSLSFKAFQLDGKVFDSFTLKKD